MRAPRARGQTPDGAGPHRVAKWASCPLCHGVCRFRKDCAEEPAVSAGPSEAARRLASQRVWQGIVERSRPTMAATKINRVVITGNLTRDPELRSLQSGNSVCSLRIASNSRRRDPSGEWVDKPNYFSVTVWGAQGENCARFLSKGRPVCIDGRLDWREWQGQDGAKREAIEIIAGAGQVLGGREGGGQGGGEYKKRLAPHPR